MNSEVLIEIELCCRDICPACAVADGSFLPSYHFWISMEQAHRTELHGWYHVALYSNGSQLPVRCEARVIRERIYQQLQSEQS